MTPVFDKSITLMIAASEQKPISNWHSGVLFRQVDKRLKCWTVDRPVELLQQQFARVTLWLNLLHKMLFFFTKSLSRRNWSYEVPLGTFL